jgi:hypothetical protein
MPGYAMSDLAQRFERRIRPEVHPGRMCWQAPFVALYAWVSSTGLRSRRMAA